MNAQFQQFQNGQAMPGANQNMPGMNPMQGMMQMMQMMMGGTAPMTMDPAAAPFAAPAPEEDQDPGLEAAVIRPALLDSLIKEQVAEPTQTVFDYLCLSANREHALGGLPKGCTLTIAGPPGKGKSRSSLAAMLNVARRGEKVAYVVAEEGFYDTAATGRDDLCSRLVKLGMAVTQMDEPDFRKVVLEQVYVVESQYHKGGSWDDFITRYRYLVEKLGVRFVVVDSLNMLDPSKNRTADNLSSLKTYNHEQGVTCVCIGQIRDTGAPVGGEALQHTADAVFLIEEMSLSSKEMAKQWGGEYRTKINVIRAVKSVTTPIAPHPIRIEADPATGVLHPHQIQAHPVPGVAAVNV